MMTEMEYLKAFPFEVALTNPRVQPVQTVTFTLAPCGECGDHPVVVITDQHEDPADHKIGVQHMEAALAALLNASSNLAASGSPEAWDLAEAVLAYRKDLREICPSSGTRTIH